MMQSDTEPVEARIPKTMRPSRHRIFTPPRGPVSRRLAAVAGLLLSVALATGCSEREPLPGPYYMTDKEEHAAWEPVVLAGEGFIELYDGVLSIGEGEPMSAVRYTGLPHDKLPVMDYEIAWEARRVHGYDFFSALTFPVGSLDTCLTLVIGGWGGKLVGFSSIDEQDAGENPYSTERDFENGRWYHFRLVVREDAVTVWINGQEAARAPVAGRRISLRPGDIEFCAPLGLATYFSEGEVKHMVMRHLRPPVRGL